MKKNILTSFQVLESVINELLKTITMLLYHNIVIISSYHHFSQALCLLLSILIKSYVSVNVTQILLAFGHENMLNLFYFDVQGIDVTFQPAALRLRPTFLRIICGQKQKNDTRPFFTLAFTVSDKRHAAQAAPQIWDKAIGQLFASYHFPLNNKERDTKKKSLRGGHFVLSRPLCLSLFCAWKTEGCTLHTKPGTFFYWQE